MSSNSGRFQTRKVGRTALESARKLFAEHRNDEALAAIDAGLKASPSDAQLRCQRGGTAG